MARTIGEIYTALIAEKEATDNGQPRYPALAALTSTSATAIWRLMLYIIAFGHWMHETLWDRHKLEIETIRAASLLHTSAWLIEEAKRWQYGDVPELDGNGKYNYTTVDETKQLVDYASIQESPGQVWMKVAHDNSGTLEPLNSTAGTELDSLVNYLNRYRSFPGQLINVINQNADELKLNIEIYYNGVIPVATIETNVLTSVNSYIQRLPFDGWMKLSALVDAIQDVDGIIDVKLNMAEGKADGQSYESITRTYNPVSGYMVLDETNSTIMYYQS